VSGPTNPFWSPGITGGAQTFAGDKTFTGTATFNKTEEAGAETVVEYKVSGDTVARAGIYNATSAANTFISDFRGTGSSTNIAQFISGRVTTDSGTNPVIVLDGRQGSSTAITTRPLLELRNSGSSVLTFLPLNSGSNLAQSYGTQAGANPSIASRSIGTRVIHYASFSAGVRADIADGVTSSNIRWWGIPENTNSYSFRWYGGGALVAELFGDGKFTLAQVGSGLFIKEGTNATMGSATLVAGAVTVSTTKVTANSRIFLTSNTDGGTPGWVRVSARTAGTSFTITSSSGSDTSTIAWIIVEPVP
jgi:hypothetical protein